MARSYTPTETGVRRIYDKSTDACPGAVKETDSGET